MKQLPDGWQTLLPSWPILSILSISFSSIIAQNRPPLALNACHSYVMLAILAPQSQGGNTSPCGCGARIASLFFPVVKITPHRLKYGKLHHSDTSRPLPKEQRCHPRQQDSPPFPRPLPTRPVHACVGGVCIMLAPPPAPTKKSTIFCIVAREPIPNRDSHFPLCEQRTLRRRHQTRHN